MTKHTTIQKIPVPDSVKNAVQGGGWLNPADRILEAHATSHVALVLKGSNYLPLNVGGTWFFLDADQDITIATALDAGVVEAGKDYCVYACVSAGALVIKVSRNTTFPAGFDANSSRKIGGFHTLCLAVGVIAGHTLTGYLAADILPLSIWDLRHRPKSEPAGMVWSEAAGIWVDIYLASGTGVDTVSVNGGTISDTRDWLSFVDDFAAVKKQLLDDAEFQIIAAGSNEKTNIAGSADPVTTSGHSDTAGRRMVSNIGCEDCCGVMWQWLRDQSFQSNPDGTTQAASKTLTATHAAAPGGNPIYLKFHDAGEPYLCCNMATDAVNKFLTFGSAYTVMIKHDAGAAAGSYQIYFDEDATQPGRILCALPGLKTDHIRTSNPNYLLQITFNAAPAVPGVAIHFDDGADERLEFISPTAANGTIDLALNSQAWNYYALPGNKGSLYKQGTYGDVKLLAGANWANGATSGSRARYAYSYRWSANAYLGGRGRAEPR
jgi:hypothetical protein